MPEPNNKTQQMTYYAVSEHERTDMPWPVPADWWYWQSPTGRDIERWVAVYADFHEDWWEGADPAHVAARPDPWCVPIGDVPQTGTLVYRTADGTEIEEQLEELPLDIGEQGS